MIKRNFTSAAVVAAGMLVTSMARAYVVDLETTNEGTAGGPTPAIFQESFQQPTGTGVIQPFLRVQANGQEQGFNTSNGTPLDDKAGPFTHDLKYSDLLACGSVNINGTAYYQILLDVNEPNGAKSIITLDKLQIFTSSTDTSSMGAANIMSLGTLRYDLDANGGDNQVRIDAGRNHGSGSGDVNIYIPVSAFAGTAPSDYVYLYSLFGQADTKTNPDGSQGGFEEFALVCQITPVPEMSALFPIVGLMVAVGSTHVLRRRKMAQASA